jgi:hypothetical protein
MSFNFRASHLLVLLSLALETNTAFASNYGIMSYPQERSFKMADFKGKTYTSVLKAKIKPSLDSLSDKKNGGGGGFTNIGSETYLKESKLLFPKTLEKYKGAKWNRTTKKYEGALDDKSVVLAYNTLAKKKTKSTVDNISYYEAEDKEWFNKNDMSLALSEAGIKGNAFDLTTLYMLTGGLGVKVKIDENNYNYHVLYKTGKTNPHTEVMSGRSFASSPSRGVADATDPEYLSDLSKYLKETKDAKPFYKTLVQSLATSDTTGWAQLSASGQLVLSDFFTVYTAEAVRHLMVDLKDGVHPWEIDLAAVTVVSALSAKTGLVVQGGAVVEGGLNEWFAPSPNNRPGGPQRSVIGITRRDRTKLQRAIHAFEVREKNGKDLIDKMQAIVGTKENTDDVIQAVFEYLSSPSTPETMGAKGDQLAKLMSQFIEVASEDAKEIMNSVSGTR